MSKKIRLLILTDEFPPKVWGGMSRSVEAIALGLLTHDYEIDIMSHIKTNQAGCLIKTEPFYQGILIWVKYPISTPKQLNTIINLDDYDIVYVNGRGFARFAQYIAKRKIKIIYSSRSIYPHEIKLSSRCFDSNKAKLEKILIDISYRIIVGSKSEKEILGIYYPDALNRVTIIPNPINPTLIKLITNIPKTRGRILYAGRFIEEKGIDFILDAIPAVLRYQIDASFVFVGGHGSSEIENKIKLAQIQYKNTVIVKDWLSYEELVKEYEKAQIVVIPSLYESFGNVALESMACGCVVIATSIGGMEEIITNYRTGIFCKARDSKEISNAIIRILSDDELSARIRYEAKQKINLINSYYPVIEKYRSLFSGGST